jgi:hypothetical protein
MYSNNNQWKSYENKRRKKKENKLFKCIHISINKDLLFLLLSATVLWVSGGFYLHLLYNFEKKIPTNSILNKVFDALQSIFVGL